jgi:CheY-like chemotaxis protein
MKDVLVIDDTEEMRSTLRLMLESEGYTVAEARDGRDGLMQLKDRAFDLVATDVFMPDVDGVEFIREARQLKPGLPVIAISGGSKNMPSAVGLHLSSALGAMRTLYKPFRKSELIKSIKDVLGEDA